MKAFISWFERLWLIVVTYVQDFLLRMQHEVAQARAMAGVTEETHADARAAMMKVHRERLFPPDCLSAGLCRGGPALFFKHDEAQEVFIGTTYDHAANELIKWFKEERAAQVEPITKASTKLNRTQRRKWKSGKW